MMKNTIKLKRMWNEKKGKLKQKIAILTRYDLLFEEGKKEEMMARLQVKLGATREELYKMIAEL